MRYEGDIYRPPSEAYSLLVQVTVGCTHNTCTFCSMFKDKRFHVRKIEEVLEDLEDARRRYRYIERMFLCDGDALCLKNEKLLVILDKIRELFPETRQVNIYGNAIDVNHKTDDELRELRDHGVRIVYIGAESGSDKVLKAVNKGSTRAEIIRAVQRIEAAGLKASVTFISGLAGKEGWEDHAVESGTMITEMNASYVALLTLIVDPRAPISQEIESGKLHLLTPIEVLQETKLLLEHANPEKSCVFRSNHASNYVNLAGNLPEDRDGMIQALDRALADPSLLRSEYLRGL
ncbi:MAG: radical SAM protein [Eubacteriales bacterium]|nr:radical SAM protein [Eubacteriales bacterium]